VTLEELLGRLERVRRSGTGAMACCPAHEDRNPSLSVARGDDRILVHCHAGCTTEQVLLALGLTWADLYEHATNNTGEFVAIYDYLDERGRLLFQVCRTPDKRFVQRRPDGNGDWIWKLDNTRRVLYRLPLVVQAVKHGYPVWIAEGEKDADALEAAGVIATCNPMGAGKWRSEYAEALAGASEVVIVADRDPEGHRHAEQVRASLVGKVGAVRLVEAAEGKDAADHLAAGRGLDDFRPIEPEHDETPTVFTVLTARAFAAIPEPDESVMLLGPTLRRAQRTLVVGDTGHGKTTLGLQMLGGVLRGTEVLGYAGAKAGPVLWLDLEQGVRSIKRGLREAGLARRDDLLVVNVPDGLALDSDDEHYSALQQLIAEHKPVVVFVDPYYKAHRADDPNAERPIGDLMRRLDALRKDHGFALLMPVHPRKDAPGHNGPRKLTLNDVAGSGGITRGAEIAFAIERLSHGYARLRILKDRDGDLVVGEVWPLVYDRELGFRRDPKEEVAQETIEQAIRTAAKAGALNTVKEWASELGIRQKRAREILEGLIASGELSLVVGPPGRSAKARLYGTDPTLWDQSGSVDETSVDSATVPTDPTGPLGTCGSGISRSTVPDPQDQSGHGGSA
jgi:hypothetical protein